MPAVEDENGKAPAGWPDRARRHWPILLVLIVAAGLIVPGLGRDHLWADEGDTAVLARSILEFGVPTAWDGVTFSDSDFGARLTDDFVMVSHPWLQYYVTAGAMAVLGESSFAARAPFALAGLATIVLVYVIVLKVTSDRRTAASAALLVTLSVQFLLFSRQSRQYSLSAALTCLLLLQFLRLTSLRRAVAFAVIGILLFHTHPIGVAPLTVLGVLTLVHRPFRDQRKWFWYAAPIIVAFTVPWLLLAFAGYAENTVPLQSLAELGPRLLQFGVECASVTSLLGAAVLYVVVRRRRHVPAIAPPAGARPLVVVLVATLVAYAAVMVLTQSQQNIWVVGMRETAAVIPFAAILTALAIAQVSRGSQAVWLVLIALVVFTRAGDLAPWTFRQTPTPLVNADRIVTFHAPVRPIDRFLRTEQWAYASSLVNPAPGTLTHVSDFLRQHAGPKDVLITNYEWEPLYFHTALPQGMKVLPWYPIYQAARRRQLPPYVFGADDVRWIVWRRAWGNYRGQDCEALLKLLADAGIHVELVASIPETTWENRENIHFRRFPDNRYLYGWFPAAPDALIFRVDRAVTSSDQRPAP